MHVLENKNINPEGRGAVSCMCWRSAGIRLLEPAPRMIACVCEEEGGSQLPMLEVRSASRSVQR